MHYGVFSKNTKSNKNEKINLFSCQLLLKFNSKGISAHFLKISLHSILCLNFRKENVEAIAFAACYLKSIRKNNDVISSLPTIFEASGAQLQKPPTYMALTLKRWTFIAVQWYGICYNIG